MKGDVEYADFVWNKSKNEENKRKHNLSFESAVLVFNDPCLLIEYDTKNSSVDEDRFNVIGSANGIVILFVTTTERNGKTRIISARKAEKTEVKRYEDHAKSLQAY